MTYTSTEAVVVAAVENLAAAAVVVVVVASTASLPLTLVVVVMVVVMAVLELEVAGEEEVEVMLVIEMVTPLIQVAMVVVVVVPLKEELLEVAVPGTARGQVVEPVASGRHLLRLVLMAPMVMAVVQDGMQRVVMAELTTLAVEEVVVDLFMKPMVQLSLVAMVAMEEYSNSPGYQVIMTILLLLAVLVEVALRELFREQVVAAVAAEVCWQPYPAR